MKAGLVPKWLREWEKENEYPQNHKGDWCIFNSKVFCQEGFCKNCNSNPKIGDKNET